MVLNYIWIAFFLVAFVIALVRLIFMGDTEVFPAIMNSTFDTSKTAFEISLGLTGVLSLWLGIMKIGEKGGVVNVVARVLSPVFTRLFPDIPKGHPVTGSIFMNVAANMLGLDNAATPLGLKAMEQLQELNPKKDTATNPMIMFLVLNTSGLTLIPVSIMVYRAQMGAVQPTDIFVPILLATFFSTLAGIIVTSLYQRINLINRTMLLTLGGMCAVVAAIIWGFSQMDKSQMNVVSTSVANILLMTIIVVFILAGMRHRINVYDAFIEGAKDGFTTAVPRSHPRGHRRVSCVGCHGHAHRRHQVDSLNARRQYRLRGCVADGSYEASLRKRSPRNDGGRHDHIRCRLVRRTSLLHLPRLHRHHLLHPRRLLRQRRRSLHPSRRGMRTAGRPCRSGGSHRNLLYVLRIDNKQNKIYGKSQITC